MRWCARCRRRLYDESAAFCPFDGTRLEVPEDRSGASDPHLGTILQGQFLLVEAIGSGAMGTVYRAWQSGMEREVAVKVLRADLTSDPELRRRFLREGRTSARLGHPNIVSVFMVGETDAGAPYLVMEHLGGETLEQVLAREGRFPPARAADIARQIGAGLAQAHAAGVVHRDLKPGNVVLLDRRGTGELVKIFDFGIAKLADRALAADGGSRLTRDGAIFGTPDYIAPEQAQGAAVDGRADLYSLGVLLYRMLAGRLPFEGNAVAVILAHIGRAPPELSAIAPDVPADLAAVVMRCLAKDPARRPATAEHFLEELARATSSPARRPSRSSVSPRAEAMARASSADPVWAARAAAARAAAVPLALEARPSRAREPGRPGRAAGEPLDPAGPASEPVRGRAASQPGPRERFAATAGPSPRRGRHQPERLARGSSDSVPPARLGTDPRPPARSAADPLGAALGPGEPPRPARVVEAIGFVLDPGGPPARAAGSSSPSRTWVRLEAGRAGPAGGPRRVARGVVTSVGLALICAGAGIGAAPLLRHAELGSPAQAGPVAPPAVRGDATSTTTSTPAASGRSLAVVFGERRHAVRALLPEVLVAGRPVELAFDLWDQAGDPLEVPAVPVTVTSLASLPAGMVEAAEPETALAARPTPGVPGRYQVAVRFASPGPAAALLELPDESSLHVHFDVGPAPR